MNLSYFTISKLLKAHKKIPKGFNKIMLCNLSLLIILFVLSFQLILSNASRLKVLGISINLESVQIFDLVNQQREANQLAPLELNDQLSQAAMIKANDMLNQNYWDHYSPNNQSPWQFITQTGYVYKYAGENLAKGFYDEKSVVSAWMASPGHKANILSDKFSQTGIATVKGEVNNEDTIFIVQLFAAPFSSEELALIQNDNAKIVNQTSELNPPIIKTQSVNDSFLSSKFVIAIVLIILSIIIFVDIKHQVRKLKFHQIVKRYWLNSLLFLVTGSVYLLTKIFSKV